MLESAYAISVEFKAEFEFDLENYQDGEIHGTDHKYFNGKESTMFD